MQSGVPSEEEAPTLYYILGEEGEVLAVYKETPRHFHYRQVNVRASQKRLGARYIGGMKSWDWMVLLHQDTWDLTRNLARVEAHIKGESCQQSDHRRQSASF